MQHTKTFKLVLSAVFCALVFAATWIAIPAGIGNVNLGDSMILIGAWTLGGPWAAVSCAAGAALCDLASGYAVYAPGTFVIKALMVCAVLLIGWLARRVRLKEMIRLPLSAVCAELVMVAGYFLYELILFETGAVADILFNCIQGAINLVVALLCYAVLRKSNVLRTPETK